MTNMSTTAPLNVNALVFEVSETLYAVDAQFLQEIVWLPKLSVIEEAPKFQLGVFDLHGTIVHVIDLDLRFGHPSPNLHTKHAVIVLRTGDRWVGIIAHHIHDLRELQPLAGVDVETKPYAHDLLAGEAHFNDRLTMLLHVDRLIPSEPIVLERLIERRDFFKELPAQQLQVFDDRAQQYRNTRTEASHVSKTFSVVLLNIGGEHFGMRLSSIVEFARLGKVYPVPSCPSFVIGNMNLRGDIVTVFDIAHLLGVKSTRDLAQASLVIFEHEQLLLGVCVDTILDVLQMESSAILPVPVGIPEDRKAHVFGEFKLNKHAVMLIDMEHILSSGALIVDSAKAQAA